jgi:hypothetical protein
VLLLRSKGISCSHCFVRVRGATDWVELVAGCTTLVPAGDSRGSELATVKCCVAVLADLCGLAGTVVWDVELEGSGVSDKALPLDL